MAVLKDRFATIARAGAAAFVISFTAVLAPGIDAATELETIVVTGMYSPQPLAELTASVTVLEEARLRQLNKRRLADALRTVPGLLVEEEGGSGGLTTISVRGGESNFTQVLLDGVPLNDPTNTRGGSYDIGNISSESIARIEVVRGAQSAVYGSDALSGVINLISRDPREVRAPELRVEVGESGYRDYRLAAGAAADDIGIALDLGRRDDEGWQDGSRREVDSANLRISWGDASAQQLSAQLRYLDGERSNYPEQSGGPLLARSDAVDVSDYRDLSAALAWEVQVDSVWRSRLAADHFDHSERFDSPGVAPYQAVPANGSDTDFERSQLSWVNTLQLSSQYQFNLGVDYRDESGESRGYLDVGMRVPTDFALSRKNRGAFVDARLRPLDAVLLQGSVRFDDPDDFDSETTLRLGASYALQPSLQLLVNWGEGFKLPSFFALGHALVGNPALQPETARGWDAGLRWRPADGLEASFTAFATRYRDLVDFDPEAFTNINRREVKTRGGEANLAWQPAENISLQANATYTDIDVVGESLSLLGRPDWQLGASLDWELSEHLHTGLDYQYTGTILASSLYTGQTVVTELSSYQRLDWRLSWRALAALEVELALDNVLDERFQTAVGFPGLGRSLRMAATLHLGRG